MTDKATHAVPAGRAAPTENVPHRSSPISPRLFSRDGMLCSALFLLCVLLTWPVAEIGINDDWSYIRTAQVFAHTHHFVYNGWATAMLGWQVLWGALFAWLFGSSFTAIRLSMIPVALLTALLFHAILRGFGLNRAHAIFGTLVLALSPLFLALSDTFMSDIPGLFSLFLCLYLCQRALAARTGVQSALWLVLAGLTNVLSGSVRQISWLGVLLIVPCCGWLLRRRRYVIPATIATWLAGVLSINLLTAWFLRHPYSIPEYGARGHIGRQAARHLLTESWRSSMTTLLFLLPVLIAFAFAVWPLRRPQLIRLACVLLGFGLLCLALHPSGRSHLVAFPWLGNIVTPHGIMQDPPLIGSRREASSALQILVTVILLVSFAGFVEAMRSFRRPQASHLQLHAWRTMSVLLVPVFIIYCLLLVPRASFILIFDRYLLFIIAVVLIYMLSAHQERVSPRIPAIATASLVVIALLGIAATHDLFAINRAAVRLLDELQHAGIPRAQIRGGFDVDSITQVDAWGFLNDPHLINPPGSYHPQPIVLPDLHDGVDCSYWFQSYVPALHPRYTISADPGPCIRPTSFAPQSYRTWLPPAKRQLFAATLLYPGTPAGALSTRP